MYKLLTILLFAPCLLFGQVVQVGVNYSPFFSYTPNMKPLKQSFSPNVDVQVGMDGFKVYASLGNTIEVGVRSGNYGLFAGMGFKYNPFLETSDNKIYFFEFGYEREIKKNLVVFVSTKHGVTLEKTTYFGCPLSLGINYKLTK